jgi:integrative and conjugative element protein (TIGR02256 family)
MLLDHPLQPGARLLVEERVLRQLRAHRQVDDKTTEAGGILVGYRRGDHLHVVAATPPGPRDVRERYAFERQDPIHQARATKGWRRSGGRQDYLGEWHTHAEALPRPSQIDFVEWRKLGCMRHLPMVFIVVGRDGFWFGVGDAQRVLQAEGQPHGLEAANVP